MKSLLFSLLLLLAVAGCSSTRCGCGCENCDTSECGESRENCCDGCRCNHISIEGVKQSDFDAAGGVE